MNEYHVSSAFSPNPVLVPLHIYGLVQSEAIGQLPTLNEGLGPQCETSLLSSLDVRPSPRIITLIVQLLP